MKIFWFFMLLFTISITQVASDKRIVNGQIAEPHSIPFQAALFVKKSGNKNIICGGSLISEKAILTAGHCLKNSVGATVILGAHDLSMKENGTVRQIVNASDFRVHPEFNYYIGNPDIALIILPTPVEYTKNIQPVELASGDLLKDQFIGEFARISGFGQYCDDCGSSKFLRYTQNRVLSRGDCIKTGYGLIPSDIQLCLSTEEKSGSCRGDSGGPLTVERNDSVVQIGLSSFGFRKCEEGAPTFFTRLNKELVDWVWEMTCEEGLKT